MYLSRRTTQKWEKSILYFFGWRHCSENAPIYDDGTKGKWHIGLSVCSLQQEKNGEIIVIT